MAESFDTVEDLKDIGIENLQAKALFKLIEKWKVEGLPAHFISKIKPSASMVLFFHFTEQLHLITSSFVFQLILYSIFAHNV